MEQELRPLPIHKHLKYISFLHSSLIPTPLLFRHLNSSHRSNRAEVFISCLISACQLWTTLTTLLFWMTKDRYEISQVRTSPEPEGLISVTELLRIAPHLFPCSCIHKCPQSGSIIPDSDPELGLLGSTLQGTSLNPSLFGWGLQEGQPRSPNLWPTTLAGQFALWTRVASKPRPSSTIFDFLVAIWIPNS